MNDFKNKTAVITGAGSGFGLEFARRAAALGMNVVMADIQADALDSASGELQSTGARIQAHLVDVSDAAQVEALAVAATERFGDIHLLFNNAGVGSGGLLWESSVADWEWTLGVNLWGVIHGIRAFVPRMLASAAAAPHYRGHVVNTASMAGLLNPPLSGIYNVSKHAVVSLSETLYHDLSLVSEQLHCSVLCPFYVPTGINRSYRNRPDTVATLTRSQRVAGAMTDKAVGSGRVSAAEVAAMTFDAVAENRFYIASHPKALEGVRKRADEIVSQHNPSDPFAARVGTRETLIDALRR